MNYKILFFTTGLFSVSISLISKLNCPFSKKMRSYLKKNGIKYRDYIVDEPGSYDIREKFNYGDKTFPLVFLDNQYIGGSEAIGIIENLKNSSFL